MKVIRGSSVGSSPNADALMLAAMIAASAPHDSATSSVATSSGVTGEGEPFLGLVSLKF